MRNTARHVHVRHDQFWFHFWLDTTRSVSYPKPYQMRIIFASSEKKALSYELYVTIFSLVGILYVMLKLSLANTFLGMILKKILEKFSTQFA